MKNSLKIMLLGGFISAITFTTAFGQAGGPLLVQVDEYGTMLINGAPGPAGVIAVDPLSGLPALSYPLPFPGNPGDIVLFEAPQTNQFSDLIRFPGNGRMYFFSDASTNDPPEPGVLADGPLPPFGPLPFLILPETGPEAGPNGLFGYVPGPGGIGGDPATPGLTYDFFSDGHVPEPGSVTLIGFGSLIALAFRRYRRA
jgi:hypothetical protein